MLSEETRYCAGCGVPIQTEDPRRSGYVPPEALEREHLVCRRCHRIRHYNEVGKTERTADDFRTVLRELTTQEALVVHIVDIFDLEGSWIPELSRYIGDNPLLLVANKVDLLPRSVRPEKIERWLAQFVKERKTDPVDIVLCSVKMNLNVERVVEKIEEYRNGRDVYIVGATNVGKSSFINRLLQQYGDGEGDEITTSYYPGTTLDAIRIPLDDNREIVDTPGIVNEDRLSERVSPDELRLIVPKTVIHPKVYQLNDGQTLFFGGLGRLDFKRGPRQPFVCYMAKDLYIHRTKTERADSVYAEHVGKMLSPPFEKGTLPPMWRQSFHVRGEKTDIVISGLGWVTCRGDAAELDVYAPKGISVSLRPALI